ncbi:MAG TPA: hypothetical protein VNU68_35385 [Verrucomicrobiae bacterium]|nr:hypothetical protein [Verrucomicrobiae bacterium]
MTGPELRSLLAEWSISRRQFADALAFEGYQIDLHTMDRWKARLPATAQRLIERWRDNPAERPGKVAPHISGVGMR